MRAWDLSGRELVTRDIDYMVPRTFVVIPRDWWTSTEPKAITR
jgi:hypothetical protein